MQCQTLKIFFKNLITWISGGYNFNISPPSFFIFNQPPSPFFYSNYSPPPFFILPLSYKWALYLQHTHTHTHHADYFSNDNVFTSPKKKKKKPTFSNVYMMTNLILSLIFNSLYDEKKNFLRVKHRQLW